MNTMTRMSKSRAKMLIKHPFFATLLMATKSVETRDVPTAATDMDALYWNPDFIESLDDEVVLFVLAHEVMHIALSHGTRCQARNHELWNIACDFAINYTLKETGFTIWDKCLYDQKYAGMSADHIYEDLQKMLDKARKNGKGKPGDQQGGGMPQGTGPGGQVTAKDLFGDGGGMIGDLKDPEGVGDPAAMARTERSIQQRVAAAVSIARMAGKFSGDLERLVKEIMDPKVPWAHVLRDYMTQVSKDDECWSRRSRRFQSVYLPSRYSEKMGEIILIGDTSGSIGNEELCQYMSEATAIAEDVRPERIRILWADTKVAGEQLFEDGDPIIPKPKGGGGTDMRVPLKHAEQFDPVVVVLFTDGYTPWPDVPPEYPLIVCCTTDAPVPVGLDVRI